MRNLVLSLIAVVIVASTSLGWLFDRVYQQYRVDLAQPNAVEVVEQLGSALATAVDNSLDGAELLTHWPNDFDYSVSLRTLGDAALPKALIKKAISGEIVLLETNDRIYYHYYLPNKKQLLVLDSPLYRNAYNPLPIKYLLTVLFYLALILLLLFWAYPLLTQLASLRKTAKAFGEGKLDKRIALRPLSYIRDIEMEFNNMANRIQNLVEDVKLLSAAVSHDLRTPLARIRFGLDTLQEVEEQCLRVRLQEKLGNDIDEMTLLVESLLSYARLDQHMFELSKVPVDLTSLINDCIRKNTVAHLDIVFIWGHHNEKILADPTYLNMAINNVIQNAIHYGQGQVAIELSFNTDHVTINVSDNGSGVELALREQIVKPFVRGTNKNHKGYGIGLAFVKKVIDWHRGNLTISDAVNMSGAMFTITLPIALD